MALTTIQALYDEARRALEAGNDERAIGLSEHMLESFPHYLEAYRILGEAHLNRQELELAVEAFGKVLQSDPENIPVHVGLGVTYERQGNLQKAIHEFEQAFEIKPDLPELRNQVLRLYGEAWGNENAHVRLKKAGLARLYMRGNQHVKAIQELQDVLANEPERLDAQVALLEALWRNDQEQEAAEQAREILRQHPHVLKANLILGYVLLAAGDSEGKRLWQHAQQLDPSQGVAQTLFDGMLPPVDSINTKLEQFDETLWREQKQQREQAAREQALREQEAREQALREQEAREQELVAELAGVGSADSWLDAVDSTPAQKSSNAGGDDFLRNLLLGAASPAPTPPPIPQQIEPADVDFDMDDLGLDIQPFSFGDEEPTTPAFDKPQTSPFDEDVSEEDTFVEKPKLAAPEAPQVPDLAGFESSDELGFGDSDDFGLDMQPFSFDDLGEDLSTLPGMNYGEDNLPDELQPFELEDVQTPPAGRSKNLDVRLPGNERPFSLDELSPEALDSEAASGPKAAGLSSATPGDRDQESGGFSWQQPTSSDRPIFPGLRRREEEPDSEDGSIFNKMVQKKSTTELPPLTEADVSHDDLDDEALSFFSHDDISLRLDLDEDEDHVAPSVTPDGADEPEMAPFSLADLGLSDDEIASLQADEATVAADDADEPEMAPFSLADLGLSDDEIASLQADEAVTEADDADEPEMAPFSLADLGLSDDEIASLQADEAVTETDDADEPEMAPFSLADLGLSDDEIASLQADEAVTETDDADEPEMAPFSLADLGLSDEEIASLQTDEAAVAADGADEPEMAPFSLADLGLSDEEIASLQTDEVTVAADGADEPEMAPFSLADLGLSDEEIASLETAETSAATPEPTGDFDFDSGITPFSLDDFDFGGSNEAPQTAKDTSTTFTEGDLEPFDMDNLDAQSGQPGISFDDMPEPKRSADAIFESLLQIGQEKGFIDLTDIINCYANPEDNAEEIDQIAIDLYQSGIAIHDGDEVIDMEEITGEYYEEDQSEGDDHAVTETESADEPEMTPFSLADLGLSPDEIATFDADGDGEITLEDFGTPAAAEMPAMAPVESADEPEMTPFSLEDLGLSPDEIATFDADGDGEITPADFGDLGAAEMPDTDEPGMTPFSFADLGLSDEEIASLQAAELPGIESEPAPTEELDEAALMTPFSLADLGLSEEEIASLQSGEIETEPVESEINEPAAPVSDDADEPEMTPFSLADLGLSDEEMANLETGEIEAEPETQSDHYPVPDEAADEPEMTPFSLADLGLTPEEIAALDADGDGEITPADFADFGELGASELSESDEPEMTPFSLEDLGLNDTEIASLNTAELPALESQASASDDVDEAALMTPFSLADLGLSDEEIAILQAGEAEAEPEITEPELTANDDMDETALMTPFSLTDLGLSDEEMASLQAGEAESTTAGEPEMTPFSLADLGLTPEEIAALDGDGENTFEDFGEPTAGMPETAPDEPDEAALMTPFSLADLGLTPEEIATFDADGEITPDDFGELGAAELPESDEPEMTPFSLADLGLSEEEIASLDAAEEITSDNDYGVMPDVAPFSLADLGLSDTDNSDADDDRNLKLSEEELASLDLTLSSEGFEPLIEPEPEWQEAEEAVDEVVTQEESVDAINEQELAPFSFEQDPIDTAYVEDFVEPVSQEQPHVEQPAVTMESQVAPVPHEAPESAGMPDLTEFENQLAQDPDNHGLRIAIARMLTQTGDTVKALNEYKHLIKQGILLEQIEEDLRDMINTQEEPRLLQQLHRTLGDTYSKQSRWREAMDEYGWVLNKR